MLSTKIWKLVNEIWNVILNIIKIIFVLYSIHFKFSALYRQELKNENRMICNRVNLSKITFLPLFWFYLVLDDKHLQHKIELSFVALWFKLTSMTLSSHTGAWVGILAVLLSIQPPANSAGKAEDRQNT